MGMMFGGWSEGECSWCGAEQPFCNCIKKDKMIYIPHKEHVWAKFLNRVEEYKIFTYLWTKEYPTKEQVNDFVRKIASDYDLTEEEINNYINSGK